MWRKELSYERVAAVFDIPSTGCIAYWERQYHSGGVNALASCPAGRPQTMIKPATAKAAVD